MASAFLSIDNDILDPKSYQLKIIKNSPLKGLIVAVLGQYNVGKTFLINKLYNLGLASGHTESTEGIQYISVNSSVGEITFVDTEGKGRPIAMFNREDDTRLMSTQDMKNSIRTKLDHKRCLEKMYENMVFSMCDVFVYVVNYIGRSMQEVITDFIVKVRRCPDIYGNLKHSKVVILHNFKDVYDLDLVKKLWDRTKEYFKLPQLEYACEKGTIDFLRDEREFHFCIGGELNESTSNVKHFNDVTLEALTTIMLQQLSVKGNVINVADISRRALENVLNQCMKWDMGNSKIELEVQNVEEDDLSLTMQIIPKNYIENSRYELHPDFVSRLSFLETKWDSTLVNKYFSIAKRVLNTDPFDKTKKNEDKPKVKVEIEEKEEEVEEEVSFSDDEDDGNGIGYTPQSPATISNISIDGKNYIQETKTHFIIELICPLVDRGSVTVDFESGKLVLNYQIKVQEPTFLDEEQKALKITASSKVQKQVHFKTEKISKTFAIGSDFETTRHKGDDTIPLNGYRLDVFEDGFIRFVAPRCSFY